MRVGDIVLAVRVNNPRARYNPTVEMFGELEKIVSYRADPLEALDELCEQLLDRSTMGVVIHRHLGDSPMRAMEQFLAILADAGAAFTPPGLSTSFTAALALHEGKPCGRVTYFGNEVRGFRRGREAAAEFFHTEGTMNGVVGGLLAQVPARQSVHEVA